MARKKQSVREILKDYYEQRKAQKKGSYSLRSYAKDLGISPGRLNALLEGVNIPSLKTIEKISTLLKLSAEERNCFHVAVELDKNQRILKQADIILKSEDMHIIVDWVPYAIISLLMTYKFELTAEAVAHRLGVSPSVANKSIEKLKALRLIENVDGRWQPTKNKIATETDIPSVMIRKSHEEKMALSVKRMHQVDVELRDYSAITFPVDLNNINVAKKLITEFRRNIAEKMAAGTPTEVYSLNIQMFPLSISKN